MIYVLKRAAQIVLFTCYGNKRCIESLASGDQPMFLTVFAVEEVVKVQYPRTSFPDPVYLNDTLTVIKHLG